MANVQSFVDYPEPEDDARGFGAYEWSAIAVAGLCLVFALISRQAHIGFAGSAFVGACAVSAAFGIGVATLNSWIPWMARHTYNVHYIVLAVMIASAWTWSLSDGFSDPGGRANLIWKGLLVGSCMWTLACIVAAPAQSPLGGLRGGLAGSALGALPFATHSILGWLAATVLLVIAASGIWPRARKPGEPLDQQVQGGIAMLGFLMVNAAVLLGLSQLVGYFGYPLIKMMNTPMEDLRMVPSTPVTKIPWDDIAYRAFNGMGGAVIGFVGTFIWRERRGPVRALPPALCAAAAFLVDGRDFLGEHVVALAIIMAAGVARPLPRMERFPHAWPAAAFGFLVGSSVVAVDSTIEGVFRILPILTEGVPFALLLAVAYFAGLRNLTYVPKQRPLMTEVG